MDERQIKRLLVTVAVSIVIIMLFKMMLTRTVVTLNKTAAEKKQAVIVKPPTEPQTTAQLPAEIAEAPNTPMAQNITTYDDIATTEETAESAIPAEEQ